MPGVLYVPIPGAPRVFMPMDTEGYRKARFGVARKVPNVVAGLFRTFVRQIPAASLSCHSWCLCDVVRPWCPMTWFQPKRCLMPPIQRIRSKSLQNLSMGSW